MSTGADPMTGRVCTVHDEYCPTGECRWCEPLPVIAFDMWRGQLQQQSAMDGQRLQQHMNEMWAQMTGNGGNGQ